MRIEKTEWGYAMFEKGKNEERQCGASVGIPPKGLTPAQLKELDEKGKIEVPNKT